jgi:hypothetical protein
MPKVINVPGVGDVDFPDSMSDQEIAAAIERDILPQAVKAGATQASTAQTGNKAVQPGTSSGQPAPKSSSWLGTMMSTAWDRVNPITQLKGLGTAIRHPIDTLNGMEGAREALVSRAADEFKKGNYGASARAAVHSLIPIMGPELERIAQVKDTKGATSPEFAGEAVGLGANVAVPAALGKLKSIRVTPRWSVPTKEAAALDYLAEKGVPVSAGVRSGNRMVRGIEEMVDTSPVGGFVVLPKVQEATSQALRKTASELAARTGARPTSPYRAGTAMHSTLERKVVKLDVGADEAYTGFRNIEARPEHLKTVQVGTEIPAEAAQQLDQLSQSLARKPYARLSEAEQAAVRQTAERLFDASAKPVFKEIAMPVDVRPIKAMLRPIYEDMSKWWEPARRSSSQGFQAVKSILEGDDFVQASVAEKGLSGLKELTREARTAATRNVNQGTAAFISKHLQDAIDSAVAEQGGGEALGLLRKGRRLTAAKYAVDDIVQQLRKEPVQAFHQAVYQKDSGIGLLRKVAKEAPKEMKRIGRAWLDDVFATATAEGESGFVEHGQRLWSEWQKLGPQTKRMLFEPTHVEDLDKFFLGVKKLAESPNPSKTAVLQMIQGHTAGSVMALVSSPVRGSFYIIGTGKLSQMLHSPRGVRALTRGIHVSVGNKAAAAAAASEILKLAGDEAKPYVLPKAAEEMPSPEDQPFSLAAVQ